MATHSSIHAGEFHGQRSLMGCSLWSHQRVRQDLATKTTTTSQSRKWIYPECTTPRPPPKYIYIYLLLCLCDPFVPVASQLQMHCLLGENERVSRGRWRGVTEGKGSASLFCCMLWAGFYSTCKARLPQCLTAAVARSFPQRSLRHFHS